MSLSLMIQQSEETKTIMIDAHQDCPGCIRCAHRLDRSAQAQAKKVELGCNSCGQSISTPRQWWEKGAEIEIDLRTSATRGRYLVARRDFGKGDVVWKEVGIKSSTCRTLADKIMEDEGLRRDLTFLYPICDRKPLSEITDVKALIALNVWDATDDPKQVVLFRWGSLLNHSCEGNICWQKAGSDIFHFTAQCNIKKGILILSLRPFLPSNRFLE